MTDIARMIAHPTDDEAERRALQTAFMNSPAFFKLFDESAKGKPHWLQGPSAIELCSTSGSLQA